MYILLSIIFFHFFHQEIFCANKKSLYAHEILSAKYKNKDFLNEVESYDEFKLVLESNNFCFFYLYNGEIVNEKNQDLFKAKQKDLLIIEEVSATNPYFKNKRINFFFLDYSKEDFKKLRKYYKPEANTEIFFFYSGEISLKEKIEPSRIKNTSNVMDLLNEGFNLNGKILKKRKKRSNKENTRIIRRNLDFSESTPCYSCPTFSASFGVGTPYWNWPGYYGFGAPWWGSPYYRYGYGRPYGGYLGIGFGASFSRSGGYHGHYRGHRRGR